VIYWGAENGEQLYRFIPHDTLVHDAIDPCFRAEHNPAFLEREEAVSRAADLVFCTAESLPRCGPGLW